MSIASAAKIIAAQKPQNHPGGEISASTGTIGTPAVGA